MWTACLYAAALFTPLEQAHLSMFGYYAARMGFYLGRHPERPFDYDDLPTIPEIADMLERGAADVYPTFVEAVDAMFERLPA